MKALGIAVSILAVCWSAVAVEQETGFAATPDSPILDTPSLTGRTEPDSDPAEAPSSAVDDLTPILEQLKLDDLPPGVTANRAERRWRVIPFGRVRGIWDDNVFISNDDPKADFSFTASPGIAAGWGDYSREVRQLGEFERFFEPLTLDLEDTPQSYFFAKYMASGTVFLENSGENALDHDALLAGRWESAKVTLGVRLRFQTLSGTDIDVGDRVKRKVTTGTITSSYKLSEKTAVELNVLGSSFDYENQVDSNEVVAESWLNYQVLPKTKLSVGGRLGTTDVKGGSTQTFEQLLARVSYYASSKLAFTVNGGVEWRQYDNNANDDFFTVFNAAATYAPFDGTVFNLTAYRRNSASVSLINENITATGIAVRLQQRFRQRFYVGVDAGYQKSEYESILSQFLGSRKDDTVYVKPSVSFDITKNLSAESAYQFQRNDSSFQETTFSENLVSVQLNLQF